MSRKKPINLTLPGPIRRPPSIIIDSIQKNLDTDDHEKKKQEEREQQEERLRSQLTVQSKLGKYGEFNDSMFELDRELGAGNGGSVERVVHKETGTIMARKLIHLDTNEEMFKKILLELNILKDCNHKRVVAFYGSYQYQRSQIRICMEYMDGGSLDKVITRFGKLHESIIGAVAAAVVEGMTYIKKEHDIIHRDIKPSNILCSTQGDIKLCDFGVSGQLVNSIVQSFVGTRSYMSPERIIADHQYGVSSDIWSLGLSLMELGYGTHPFPRLKPDEIEELMRLPEGTPAPQRAVHVDFIDILADRVENDAPKLSSEFFGPDCCEFIDACLRKEPDQRPTLDSLSNFNFVKHYGETITVQTIATYVKKSLNGE
ncbi:Oidioi.mRNA.OKI2018_I69.chr1.g1856.t1.cds [Oikopleura dioica]|uniref:mitogen-activated protein kinase kinase n=1 Tax=Oikopleura dioica TaxID=34765 RepID=A0ABN7SQW7_OIKDI|nr:Oidioi.mRNA.OKI2018_I69.chr1.g1856.t1.cds [Oikopleura dioica]